MMDDTVIRVDHVSKSFRLPHDRNTSIKSAVINIGHHRKGYSDQQVLKDVSFDIKKGEFFGIVGRNGSGKSTLLKLIAGIYEPTAGIVQINGKLTPFIELGVGFNMELTGRENVFLSGALLGFSRKEMMAMYDEIVDFAELRPFMDQKLKNYSSGMQVRLAFSIAIRAQSDILVLDEVLAVGDENFQRKCYEYFAQIKNEQKTVVFVSHDMNAVRDFCTQAVLVHDGKIIEQGDPSEIIVSYSKVNAESLDKELDKKSKGKVLTQIGSGEAVIQKIWTERDNRPRNSFAPHDTVKICVEVVVKRAVEAPVFGINILDSQNRVVFATNTNVMGITNKDLKAGHTVTAEFTLDNIYTNGSYTISGAVANKDRTAVYARVENAHTFAVTGWQLAYPLAHPDHTFMLK